LGEAVERVPQKVQRDIGHVRDAAERFARHVFAVQRVHPLADVLSQIADPFELVGNPQNSDYFAQVDRHGLARGDGRNCLLLDVALLSIESRIRQDDAFTMRAVAPYQTRDGFNQLTFCKPTHLGDHAGEVKKVGVEGSCVCSVRAIAIVIPLPRCWQRG
jgi:hypothetical protein